MVLFSDSTNAVSVCIGVYAYVRVRAVSNPSSTITTHTSSELSKHRLRIKSGIATAASAAAVYHQLT